MMQELKEWGVETYKRTRKNYRMRYCTRCNKYKKIISRRGLICESCKKISGVKKRINIYE